MFFLETIRARRAADKISRLSDEIVSICKKEEVAGEFGEKLASLTRDVDSAEGRLWHYPKDYGYTFPGKEDYSLGKRRKQKMVDKVFNACLSLAKCGYGNESVKILEDFLRRPLEKENKKAYSMRGLPMGSVYPLFRTLLQNTRESVDLDTLAFWVAFDPNGKALLAEEVLNRLPIHLHEEAYKPKYSDDTPALWQIAENFTPEQSSRFAMGLCNNLFMLFPKEKVTASGLKLLTFAAARKGLSSEVKSILASTFHMILTGSRFDRSGCSLGMLDNARKAALRLTGEGASQIISPETKTVASDLARQSEDSIPQLIRQGLQKAAMEVLCRMVKEAKQEPKALLPGRTWQDGNDIVAIVEDKNGQPEIAVFKPEDVKFDAAYAKREIAMRRIGVRGLLSDPRKAFAQDCANRPDFAAAMGYLKADLSGDKPKGADGPA